MALLVRDRSIGLQREWIIRGKLANLPNSEKPDR